MISGQATFGSTGSKSIYFGFNVTELLFRSGSSAGFANSSHQFCLFNSTSNSETKSMILYSGATKVLEFEVTGGWGTPTVTFNVTYASASYPFDVGAR